MGVIRTVAVIGVIGALALVPPAAAVSGDAGSQTAAAAQYEVPVPSPTVALVPTPTATTPAEPTATATPTAGAGGPEPTATPEQEVQGEQEEGGAEPGEVIDTDTGGGPATDPGGGDGSTEPGVRTLELGADGATELPFTGAALIGLLIAGVLALGGGLVLRGRTGSVVSGSGQDES